MSTSTKRPSTITQTSGSYASGKYYRTWSNLANLRNEASFADCGVSGKLIGEKWDISKTRTIKIIKFWL